MLTTVLTNIKGFFSSEFLLAYFMPSFLAAAWVGLTIVLTTGWSPVLKSWSAQSAAEQGVVVAITVLIVTVFAYMLQTLAPALLRLAQGYGLPRWWGRLGQAHQLARSQALRAKDPALFLRFYPEEEALVRPTALGNALEASTEHVRLNLHLDPGRWWTRLQLLIEDRTRTQIDAALLPLLAWVNLSFLIGLTGVLSALYVIWTVRSPLALFLSLDGALALAWLSARAAVQQGAAYGDAVRAVFDLKRHDLLRALGIQVPETLAEEQRLWDWLNEWVYEHRDYREWRGRLTPQEQGKLSRPWFGRDFRYAAKAKKP